MVEVLLLLPQASEQQASFGMHATCTEKHPYLRESRLCLVEGQKSRPQHTYARRRPCACRGGGGCG